VEFRRTCDRDPKVQAFKRSELSTKLLGVGCLKYFNFYFSALLGEIISHFDMRKSLEMGCKPSTKANEG